MASLRPSPESASTAQTMTHLRLRHRTMHQPMSSQSKQRVARTDTHLNSSMGRRETMLPHSTLPLSSLAPTPHDGAELLSRESCPMRPLYCVVCVGECVWVGVCVFLCRPGHLDRIFALDLVFIVNVWGTGKSSLMMSFCRCGSI